MLSGLRLLIFKLAMKSKTYSLIFNVKAEDKDYTKIIADYLSEIELIFKGIIPEAVATLSVLEEKDLHDIL